MQLTQGETAFLADSVRLREAEGEEKRESEVRTQRLRRRTRWQLVALFTAVALLAGVIAYPILTDDGPPTRIGIALQFDRDESGFDELMARGLENAAEEHGLQAVVLEPPYSSLERAQADVADGAELVFGSSLMWDSMWFNAPSTPRYDVGVSGLLRPPWRPERRRSELRAEEGSFLVGAAAAARVDDGDGRLHRRQPQPPHRGVPRRLRTGSQVRPTRHRGRVCADRRRTTTRASSGTSRRPMPATSLSGCTASRVRTSSSLPRGDRAKDRSRRPRSSATTSADSCGRSASTPTTSSSSPSRSAATS